MEDEEFTIDFEKENIAALGISDIRGFDIDSEGAIYLSNYIRGSGDCIFKFTGNGNFITSFGRKGQGPGEFHQYAKDLCINEQDLIQTFAPRKHSLIIYSKDRRLVKEIPLWFTIHGITALKNGKFLASETLRTHESLYYYRVKLSLYNADFDTIKELENVIIPNRASASYWMVSEKNIYVGNDERGYEIWVYDLKGNLLRKIRKEYEPIEIPEEIKKRINNIYKEIRKRSSWTGKIVDPPKHWPPFSTFFSDEKERLYVRTWEKGKSPGEYIHDIFNQDGVFIGRTTLNIFFSRACNYAKVKKDRLYSIREKENGYKELVVYKMKWE